MLNDRDRTNNSVESWHKHFAADVGKHPNIIKLIKGMVDEQHLTDFIISGLKSGDTFVYRSRKTHYKDARIKTMCESFSKNDDILQYLDAMNKNFNI